MAGRNPDRERARIIALVREYLSRADNDHSLELSHAAIATATRTSRTNYSRTDHPDWIVLTEDIVRANNAQRQARAIHPISDTGASVDAVTLLSDGALAARIRAHSDDCALAMHRWLQRHERQRGPVNAALLLADLDRAIRELRREAEALRPAVEAWQTHRNIAADELAGPIRIEPPAQTALILGE
jgi:hypothetical protein